MKLALVDDHALFREALRATLGIRAPDIEVLGEFSTAREVIHAGPKLAPDVILMDVLLTGTSGIAATRELRRLGFTGHVMILTALTEPAFVIDAFAAGVQGYALKEQTIDDLLLAIRRVSGGQPYVAPRLEAALAERQIRPVVKGPGLMETLSTREREVFSLIVAGHTNQRMAAELCISVKTIETHRSRINKKLCVHSTAELVRFAALHDLISA